MPPFVPEDTPLVVLAEGCLGLPAGKTASGVIRYGRWPIVGVIDSTQEGKTVGKVLNLDCKAPILGSFRQSLGLTPKPQALLLGTAPQGGFLTKADRAVVREALTAGLHVISGLHQFLTADPEFVALAQQFGATLWDVRAVDDTPVINQLHPRPAGTQVITLVGTDCSVGKMVTALELDQGARRQGLKSAFVATGQTGILISGRGIPLDRVIGDFMAGRVEQAILDEITQSAPEVVFVEGQGAIYHPAYSGITLALIHGSQPDGLILCHNPSQSHIRNYPQVPIPPWPEMIARVETVASWLKPCKVLGISLNTSAFDEAEAQRVLEDAQAQTGLPATDPVRFGVEPLLQALQMK